MSLNTQLATLFNFDSATVRTLQRDGEPWFVATDVCEVLTIANPSQALSRLDDDERTLITVEGAPNGLPVNVISESGLYSLTLTSRKPIAKRLKKWVTSEVLPMIRKTGSYIGVQAAPAAPTTASMFFQSVQVMLEMEGRTAALEKQQLAITARLYEVVENNALKVCPQSAEPISHIRKHIGKAFGLPTKVIDEVMRQLSYSPETGGMVLNDNEAAQGLHYAVFWVKDVTTMFKRFVAECQRETTAFVSHPFIDARLKLAAGKECK